MKRLFIIGLVALFAVACQQEVDSPSVAESGSRAVEPQVMEQFVADLISGRTFGVSAVEITLDGEVIKAFDEIMYGTIGAKYYDYGCNTPYLFYEDGTCRMGYITTIYNVCGKPGHGALYDTLTWSYNIEEATITLKSEDLPYRPYGETFKVVEYKDNKVLIEGQCLCATVGQVAHSATRVGLLIRPRPSNNLKRCISMRMTSLVADSNNTTLRMFSY